MKILGIIPARGGSKGIPNKNLLEIDGKSLLRYAIEAGKESKMITDLIVSTDSLTIEQEARDCKVNVSLRPENLASDFSDVSDTVEYILKEFEKNNNYYDIIVLLQPTAPLRTGKDIDNALELLEQEATDAVISVVKVEDHHPGRMYSLEAKMMTALYPEWEKQRRQDLPAYYLRNGCIYAIQTKVFLKEGKLIPNNKAAYVMNHKWWVNIDTPTDVYVLERLMPLWKKENGLK